MRGGRAGAPQPDPAAHVCADPPAEVRPFFSPGSWLLLLLQQQPLTRLFVVRAVYWVLSLVVEAYPRDRLCERARAPELATVPP